MALVADRTVAHDRSISANLSAAVNLTSPQYHALMHEGVLDTEPKRKKFLALCAEELEGKRREWKDLQVSVVAGAGFEPATFRL